MTAAEPPAVQVGEGVAGAGAHLAHVNTVLGRRDGPVGAAFATALAQPSVGHVPFLAVVRPGVAVQPPTLFVNKATLASDAHATLTWGPAQAGVAQGVARALGEATIAPEQVGELVIVAAVWVDPAASDADAVFEHNAAATLDALRAGRAAAPTVADVLAAADDPWNASFRPR